MLITFLRIPSQKTRELWKLLMISGAKWKCCYWWTFGRPQLEVSQEIKALEGNLKVQLIYPQAATWMVKKRNVIKFKCPGTWALKLLHQKLKMRSSISFCKTIGNKYWLSVQPFCSHYSQPSKWPLSHLPLSLLLLFWPEIDHIPSKQRQRISDVKQKQSERIERIQETFKKQKQRCLNSLARS